MSHNFANDITNLECVHCKSTDKFTVGRKLMGGSNHRLFLVCTNCGTHCTIDISTHFELVTDWWR